MKLASGIVVVMLGLLSLLSGQELGSGAVKGVMIIPADVATFAGQTVDLRLYKYDPRIADKAADLADQIALKDFGHTEGKETRKEFVLAGKANFEPGRNYYISAFILKGDKRTHHGRLDHDANGIGKVLTPDTPKEIVVRFKTIK